MGQRRPFFVSRPVGKIKPISGANSEISTIALHGPDTDFWPLQISHDTYRPPCGQFYGAYGVQSGEMIGVLAMAKIKPEQIRTSRMQTGNGFLIATGRT